MSQKDITLRQGHATPATIILRALEAAPPSPTTTIYLYEFHATPSTVVLGDPTTVRVAAGAQTYEFTGSVALTFAVASDVDFGDTQPADVAITFAVGSPVAVAYAEPVAVALTFGVAADVDFGDVQPADVVLTFAVEAAFEYVAGEAPAPEPETQVGGDGGWGYSVRRRRKDRKPIVYPRTFTFYGDISYAVYMRPVARYSFTAAPHSTVPASGFAPGARIAVALEMASDVRATAITAATPMSFNVHPQQDEWLILDPDDWLGAILNEEELALGGVR